MSFRERGLTPHTNRQARWWTGDDLGFLATTGPGHLTVSEPTMNSTVYQSIVELIMRPSV